MFTQAEIRTHRRDAESRMTDTCTIEAPATTGTVWNPATASWDGGTTVTVYAGKCRLKRADPTPSQAQAGPETRLVTSLQLLLPVDGTELVGGTAQIVTYTSARDDASLVGRRFGVTGASHGSQQIQRHVGVKETTG